MQWLPLQCGVRHSLKHSHSYTCSIQESLGRYSERDARATNEPILLGTFRVYVAFFFFWCGLWIQFVPGVLHSCLPLHSFVILSSRLSTPPAVHSKCICPNTTQTTRAPNTARRLAMGPMPGCHLVYACFPISLALEEKRLPHSQLLLALDCSRVLAIAY